MDLCHDYLQAGGSKARAKRKPPQRTAKEYSLLTDRVKRVQYATSVLEGIARSRCAIEASQLFGTFQLKGDRPRHPGRTEL
jgi:hypothetical protein